MTAKHVLGTLILTLALVLASAAHATGIKNMEHYFRVSGAVNAANGACEMRGNIPKLLELGKPYQLKERNPELEENMISIMVQSLNDTGARIVDEGHDVVCPELLGLYGPNGTEVPGLLAPRDGN